MSPDLILTSKLLCETHQNSILNSPKGLLDFLFDTYTRYKFDSPVFISSLGEKAKKCRYFCNSSSSAHFPLAKQKANTKSKSGSKCKQNFKPQGKSVIPLGELSSLANAIDGNQNGEVPSSVLLVLRNIIKARGECAGRFSA